MKNVVVGIISEANANGEESWLLVSSAKDFGEYTGYYYPPGGHIEAGETEEEALMREIKEELSLIARPIARLAISQGDVADQRTYWWQCEVTGDMEVNPELKDAQYFTRAQMENDVKVWPATRNFFRDFVFKKPD